MKHQKDDELHALLRLISVPGLGSFRIRKLISKFGSPSEIFSAGLPALMSLNGIDKVIATNIIKKNNTTFADEQLTKSKRLGIQILPYYNDNYPESLKSIPDLPVVLYIKGEILSEDYLGIAIVGTRMPSDYGKIVTEKLTIGLVKKGFTIISGLARGIDTIAHINCLKQGGRTIAVLGSGLDIIYPPENKKLAESIIEKGAVISELPCGSKPDAVNFPKRNRIISGLSLGVLITEAGVKSGALITTNAALEQNREVFSVPGSILSPKSSGTNQLLKEGAKLVQNEEDILEELDSKIRHFLRENPKFKEPLPDLSENEEKLLTLLSDQPNHIDLIVQKSGFSIPESLSLLLTLELKEVVKQLPGKLFLRC